MFIRKKYLTTIQTELQKQKLILLTGARQVGKTTILKQVETLYNGQMPTMYINCEYRPERPFTTKDEMIRWFAINHNIDIRKEGLLLLDEIQIRDKVELFLKIFYDSEDIKAKLIATGSRFLGQSIPGSTLVGRGKTIKVFPFSFIEFLQSQGKNLEKLSDVSFERIKSQLVEYLTFGGYPAVIFSLSKEDKIRKLQEIINLRQDKDMSYFLKADHKPSFVKMMQHIALNIGNVYKEDPICASLSVSRQTVKNMLNFMIKSFIATDIYPYFLDTSKEYNTSPEIFFNDIGWINYLRSNRENTDLIDGKINENFVAIQCAYNSDYTLCFYKKRSGSEIDFIVKDLEGNLIPIEVKSQDSIHIPKSFPPFLEVYKDKVKYCIVTTKSIEAEKELAGKKIYFVPFWRIGEILQK